MILRKLVKKVLSLDESTEVMKLKSRVEWYKGKLDESEDEKLKWKGQANVDATECLALKKKLRDIRVVLGGDDEVFSKYSRDQIRDMDLDEFYKIEHLIDQDISDGKLFLQ